MRSSIREKYGDYLGKHQKRVKVLVKLKAKKLASNLQYGKKQLIGWNIYTQLYIMFSVCLRLATLSSATPGQGVRRLLFNLSVTQVFTEEMSSSVHRGKSTSCSTYYIATTKDYQDLPSYKIFVLSQFGSKVNNFSQLYQMYGVSIWERGRGLHRRFVTVNLTIVLRSP